MKFNIFVHIISIVTGILILNIGLGVDKDMETLFSIIIIGLGVLNIIYELMKLIKRENIKRHNDD